MNTRKLSQDPHTPAKATQTVVDMQGTRPGTIARDNDMVTTKKSRIVQQAELASSFAKPSKKPKEDLSHFGKHD